MTRSTFFELSNLEHASQTNGVTESDVKEVTEKLLKNAIKRKGGEMVVVINTTNVD